MKNNNDKNNNEKCTLRTNLGPVYIEVGDPGLVGLVSFVFTLCGAQNKIKLPH